MSNSTYVHLYTVRAHKIPNTDSIFFRQHDKNMSSIQPIDTGLFPSSFLVRFNNKFIIQNLCNESFGCQSFPISCSIFVFRSLSLLSTSYTHTHTHYPEWSRVIGIAITASTYKIVACTLYMKITIGTAPCMNSFLFFLEYSPDTHWLNLPPRQYVHGIRRFPTCWIFRLNTITLYFLSFTSLFSSNDREFFFHWTNFLFPFFSLRFRFYFHFYPDYSLYKTFTYS